MEKILKQIIGKLDGIDTRLDGIDTRLDGIDTKLDRHEARLDRIEPMVEESHLWLRTLIENKEVQRAKMDKMENDLARVQGVLNGFDKSLEIMKKAQ